MNHSYHEMVIGHGRCFSTVLLSEKPEKLTQIEYSPDYHRAQFLATQMALAERGRYVVSILMKDLEAGTQTALEEFFKAVAAALRQHPDFLAWRLTEFLAHPERAIVQQRLSIAREFKVEIQGGRVLAEGESHARFDTKRARVGSALGSLPDARLISRATPSSAARST